MTKRIALLQNGIVTNVVVGNSTEEIANLFACEAIEVTTETEQAFIGLGYSDGKFEQPPPTEDTPVVLEISSLELEEQNKQ